MAAITAQLLQTMRWTDIHAKAPTSRHRTVYALVFFVILIGMYFEVYSKVITLYFQVTAAKSIIEKNTLISHIDFRY